RCCSGLLKRGTLISACFALGRSLVGGGFPGGALGRRRRRLGRAGFLLLGALGLRGTCRHTQPDCAKQQQEGWERRTKVSRHSGLLFYAFNRPLSTDLITGRSRTEPRPAGTRSGCGRCLACAEP